MARGANYVAKEPIHGLEANLDDSDNSAKVAGAKLDLFDPFPVLETPRLRLRELVEDDKLGLYEIFRDDAVTRYYDLETMTNVAAAAQFIAEMQQRYADRVGIRWAIVDRANGELIGSIGCNSTNVFARRAAIGYEIAPRFWSRGFATEAVREVVRFGHAELRLQRIEALVMLGNEASVRVLNKSGFQEEGVLRSFGYWRNRYHDLRLFSILRPS